MPVKTFAVTALLALAAATPAWSASVERPLRVSDDARSLVTSDGRPFFYLGDTAWELFHVSTREEATLYLRDRAEKGYTVIQAVALAEVDGLNRPNAYGFRPLINNDPLKPDVKPGADNDYWDHVDFVISEAEKVGLRIGLLPTWGDKWQKRWGAGPEIFSPENARAYGEWIGRRYKDRAIIWIMGGDRRPETEQEFAIINAMADGVRAGDGGRNLMTFHPMGGGGTSELPPIQRWVEFNARQNGHNPDYKEFDKTLKDYQLTPVKPVIDIEPLYEDHPLYFKPDEFGHSIAADVRRPLYWDLFNGAAGHTYGHHSIWQFYDVGREPVNRPLMTWREAILQPGGRQMQYGKKLVLSRDFLHRVPAPELVPDSEVVSSVPGAGRYRFAGLRGADQSWAMVYVPVGRSFTVDTSKLTGATLRAWWFNPRDGTAALIGDLKRQDRMHFGTPAPGEALDWVLVLDDASRNYPAPGSRDFSP
ncbi:glycoside hydrolase family 140 protein [Nibricoccus sp. IMCC34717]|uniref:glycoside hydrolase family 140 protein n=1 Tax=Nibricoccus sp. IMCC34717 TaxID=3034021 RepID=UPI00384D8B44